MRAGSSHRAPRGVRRTGWSLGSCSSCRECCCRQATRADKEGQRVECWPFCFPYAICLRLRLNGDKRTIHDAYPEAADCVCQAKSALHHSEDVEAGVSQTAPATCQLGRKPAIGGEPIAIAAHRGSCHLKRGIYSTSAAMSTVGWYCDMDK